MSDSIKQTYALQAEGYDALYTAPRYRAQDEFVRSLLCEYAITPVLDLGCGTGLYLDMFPEDSNLDNYRGIDLSPDMLRVARRKHDGSLFVCGDVSDLSRYRSGSFKSVIALNGVPSYIQSLDSWAKEIHRVLAPNGYAVLMPHGPLARKHPTPCLEESSDCIVRELFQYILPFMSHFSIKECGTIQRWSNRIPERWPFWIHRNLIGLEYLLSNRFTGYFNILILQKAQNAKA